MTLVAPHVQSQCGPLFGLRVFLRDLVCVFILYSNCSGFKDNSAVTKHGRSSEEAGARVACGPGLDLHLGWSRRVPPTTRPQSPVGLQPAT